MTMARIRSWLDINLTKFMSRKLFVFGIATVMLVLEKITEDNWTPIAIAYIGLEGFADMAIRWKTGVLSTFSKTERMTKEVGGDDDQASKKTVVVTKEVIEHDQESNLGKDKIIL